jgi:DNA polymerase-3 subunit chi
VTRIDFYLQQAEGAASLDSLVCRLVDKAFRQGHRTYVLTADAESATRLDNLLWTFSGGSFVPHGLYTGDGDAATEALPVMLGHREPPPVWHDVLVTLGPDVPSCFSRFERVAEVVGASEEAKIRARERFRFYRDRGYPLETHEI